MDDSPFSWVFKIPCIISVVLNFVFLVWIVLVLLSKLSGGAAGGHSASSSDHSAAVKTARAIGGFPLKNE